MAKHPLIAALIDLFDTGQSAGLQKTQQGREVIRRAIAQAQHQCLVCPCLWAAPEGTRLGMIGFGKGRIETTQATKAGCHCHFSDRQVGFGQQLLGKQQALGGMHGHRRRPRY
jgi:hypothetical protein